MAPFSFALLSCLFMHVIQCESNFNFESVQENLKKALKDLNIMENMESISDHFKGGVAYEGIDGEKVEMNMHDFKEKMKNMDNTLPNLQEKELVEGKLAMNELKEKDPELAMLVSLAQFGLESLQAQRYAIGYKLSGFTDPNANPDGKKEVNHIELILKVKKENEKDLSFQLHFHGNKKVYQGGVGIIKAWVMNTDGKKAKKIKLPVPPLPLLYNPTFLLLAAGGTMIIMGALLCLWSCCCATHECAAKKKKKE